MGGWKTTRILPFLRDRFPFWHQFKGSPDRYRNDWDAGLAGQKKSAPPERPELPGQASRPLGKDQKRIPPLLDHLGGLGDRDPAAVGALPVYGNKTDVPHTPPGDRDTKNGFFHDNPDGPTDRQVENRAVKQAQMVGHEDARAGVVPAGVALDLDLEAKNRPAHFHRPFPDAEQRLPESE